MDRKYRSRVRVLSSQYFSDEAKGTVTCVMEVSVQLDKNPMYNFFRYTDLDSLLHKKLPYFINPFFGIFKVKTTVRCSSGDKFDLKLGSRIAEAKCKIKAFRTGEKANRIIRNEFWKAAEEFGHTAEACAYARNVEENHLEELNNEVCPKNQ